MKRFFPILLVSALGACAGAPSEDERVLTLFDRVAYLLAQYNAALATQEGLPLDAATNDLRKLAAAEFDRLAAGLAGGDAVRQGEAAFALGFSRRREAVAPLLAACASPDAVVRANAIAALGMLGFEDGVVPAFQKLLGDAEAEVRLAALFGLRTLVDETRDLGLLPAVHARLADPATGVRNEALILLRDMKRKESVEPILTRSIKDVEPLVRANAALAVGAVGPAVAKVATPPLIEMLRDEETKVVDSAWKALTVLNQKDFDRSYATWRDWYEDELRHHWTCPEHRDVSQSEAGDCPHCKRKLDRVLLETSRRVEAPPAYFVCPDHPEVTVSTPGACGKPGCGKPLQAAKPPAVSYACPEHPEVTVLGPSTCARPGCGKTLVPRK
jgi:hypothetical protein